MAGHADEIASTERQARLLLATGDAQAAIYILRHALAISDHWLLRRLLGEVLRVHGDIATAVDELLRARACAPDDRETVISLLFALCEHGRVGLATRIAVDWVSRSPRSSKEMLAIAGFLNQMHAYSDTFELLQSLPERNTQAELLLASCAMNLGDFGVAQAGFRRVLARDPDQAAAWLRLAHCRRFNEADDADIVALRVARGGADEGSVLAISLDYALGKALDDMGDYQSAAALFRRANLAAAAQQPWSVAAYERQVEGVLATISYRVTAPIKARGSELLWIVGVPRSGTTLLADRLGRHPAIRNRGESNWLQNVAEVWRLNSRETGRDDQLARMYLSQILQDDVIAKYYIDKNPLNLLWFDAGLALVPGANIICVKRDHRDTALSLWSNQFAHPALAFSNNFAHISAFMRGYQRLTEALLEMPGSDVTCLDYADLVRDTDSTLARIWRALDLPQPPTVVSGQATVAVATASVFQVREEVHTRSIDRWKRYLPWLPELAAIAQ